MLRKKSKIDPFAVYILSEFAVLISAPYNNLTLWNAGAVSRLSHIRFSASPRLCVRFFVSVQPPRERRPPGRRKQSGKGKSELNLLTRLQRQVCSNEHPALTQIGEVVGEHFAAFSVFHFEERNFARMPSPVFWVTTHNFASIRWLPLAIFNPQPQ